MPERCRLRVLLADDYPLLLPALRRLLEPQCEIVAAVSSGREAVEMATALSPDIAVLDLTMRDLDGLEACRRIRLAVPTTKVVILTAADDPDLRAIALKAGASDLVSKHSVDGLKQTIQRIFEEI